MQRAVNQMVFMALQDSDAPKILSALCLIANRHGDEPWVTWLDRLAADAEALLAKGERKKESDREAGATRSETRELVRAMKEAAKPSRAIRNDLAAALDSYRMERELRFDPASCKVLEKPLHRKSVPTAQLVAFTLCLAIRDGYWQSFRRCRESKCRKLFFDHMPRGRRAQRYCCRRHQNAHSKRVARGTA